MVKYLLTKIEFFRKAVNFIRSLFRDSDSKKIVVIGNNNVVEGQSVNTNIQTQLLVENPRNTPVSYIECRIGVLITDEFGEGLDFHFRENRYFASIRDLTNLCSGNSVIDGVYSFNNGKLVKLISLFKLFDPNTFSLSPLRTLRAAIAEELLYRDICIEIITDNELAKRLPFLKLRNHHFGINNHFIRFIIRRE